MGDIPGTAGQEVWVEHHTLHCTGGWQLVGTHQSAWVRSGPDIELSPLGSRYPSGLVSPPVPGGGPWLLAASDWLPRRRLQPSLHRPTTVQQSLERS